MYVFMQEQVREIQSKYRQAVTKENLDSKRKLLEFRNGLVEQVFDKARKRLEEFSYSADYPAFLVERLKESAKNFPCGNAVIYVREQDIKYLDDIRSTLPAVSVEADKKNRLGGYKIINPEQGLLLDESFESNLQKQRHGFYKQCGLSVAV